METEMWLDEFLTLDKRYSKAREMLIGEVRTQVVMGLPLPLLNLIFLFLIMFLKR